LNSIKSSGKTKSKKPMQIKSWKKRRLEEKNLRNREKTRGSHSSKQKTFRRRDVTYGKKTK
jgi:hypothetical protein